MASVRKRVESKFWYACYTLPNGRRKQISTGLEDKNLALQVALKLEHASGLSARGVLTKEVALRLVDEIAACSGVQIIDPISSRSFLTKFFEVKSRGLSKASADKYRAFSQYFFDYLAGLAARPMAEVTPAIVADWRDNLLQSGRSPATVRNAMAGINMAFVEARSQGRIKDNPFESVKRPTVRKADRQVKHAFSWDQFKALVGATEGDWRICILLGGFTGQRQQDVAQLTWDRVDFEAGTILFSRRKTHDDLMVPMHPQLRSALLEWHISLGRPADGKVLPELSALNHNRSGGFAEQFRFEILPRIGIDQPYTARGGSPGRTVSAYSYHSLRHMLSTALNSAGVSAETRMLIVGHADRKVSAGYTHAQLADAVGALEQLPGL